MDKTLLLTPGPTQIPPAVLAEMSKPIIHHRTKDFETVFEEVRKQLQWLFQTKQEVLSIAATGTGVMEATVVNLFSPGDAVITVNGGKFGERWTKISNAYGLKATEVFVERGKAVTIAQLETALQNSPGAKAILFQASETSTGVAMPTEAITKLCKKHNILSVCDAITACGVFDLPMDAWGIDVLITASQKALMLPPGLAFIAFSDKAWEAAKVAKCPKFYFDLNKELKAQLKNQTAWTPAISIIFGARISLGMMMKEGRENMYARHEKLAAMTRKASVALGMELFSSAASAAVTTVCVPSGVANGKKIVSEMREQFGIIIAGGQDELEGKIFRLSHFGYCSETDLYVAFGALEKVLKQLGHSFKAGASLEALNI